MHDARVRASEPWLTERSGRDRWGRRWPPSMSSSFRFGCLLFMVVNGLASSFSSGKRSLCEQGGLLGWVLSVEGQWPYHKPHISMYDSVYCKWWVVPLVQTNVEYIQNAVSKLSIKELLGLKVLSICDCVATAGYRMMHTSFHYRKYWTEYSYNVVVLCSRMRTWYETSMLSRYAIW